MKMIFISNNAHQIEAPSFLHTFLLISFMRIFHYAPATATAFNSVSNFFSLLRFPPEIFLRLFFYFLFFFCRKAVKFNFIMSHFLNNNIFSWILHSVTHFIFELMWIWLSYLKRKRVASCVEAECVWMDGWMEKYRNNLPKGDYHENKIIIELAWIRNCGFDDSSMSIIYRIQMNFVAIISDGIFQHQISMISAYANQTCAYY